MKNYILELINSKAADIINRGKSKHSNDLKVYSEIQITNVLNIVLESFKFLLENNTEKLTEEKLLKLNSTFLINNISKEEVTKFFSSCKNAILNEVEEQNREEKFSNLFYFVDSKINLMYSDYLWFCIKDDTKELVKEKELIDKRFELNQQYLENILHYSDSAIMVIGISEEFIAWNKGAEKIFGYTKKDILGKKSSFLLPEDDKYKDELYDIIAEVDKKGSSKIVNTERKTKTGKIIPVQLHVAKLPGKDNEYTGRTVVITDVTEVRKLQQQVDQSEKLAVIGQLAAGVAHEIGNPLTSISSLVQILQRRYEDEFASDKLSSIKSNIDRISKIVRELVDLSRPPSHDELFTQISDVVRTAMGIVKYDKRVKNVIFETDFELNLPATKIVPDQLLQVFINILINALDAIEGEGTISVKTSGDTENIYVDINDNGVGISEKEIGKIFNPFYTTKEVGKGTGLGLSVSYGIIKRFNGNISVTSNVAKGSNFKIEIPIYKVKLKPERTNGNEHTYS
ncbi:MAG: ATP-binding protein [Melioribacteraceae bacterium]